MASAKAILLIGVALMGSACGQPDERVGANSLEELRTPRAIVGNNVTVPGCCSFRSAGVRFERRPSDSFILEAISDDLQISVAFGAFESTDLPAPNIVREIDGVSVRGTTLTNSEGRVSRIWTAKIPPSSAGAEQGLRPYGLRIEARCRTASACQKTEELIASLRF